MRFNKFGLSIVSLILILIITACGNNNSNNTSDNIDAEDDWPEDEITLITPFDAGGSVDNMARGFAPYLEDELGTDIKIENKPGASGQIGSTEFVNSPDDGSTFFVGTQLYLSANIVLEDADFDIDDFSMINFEQFDPITITVPEDSPYETLDDLLDAIEEKPGELSYSTISGGALHLTGVILEDKLDIDIKPVFYDGGGEMRNALIGDQVDFMIGNATGDLAIEDKSRVLGIASDDEEELDMYEDAEPINEVLNERDEEDIPYVGSARFIAAHSSFKEEHPELFDKFVDDYEKMFESDEYQEHLEEQGADIVSEFRGPEESDEMNQELHELVEEYKDDLEDDEE